MAEGTSKDTTDGSATVGDEDETKKEQQDVIAFLRKLLKDLIDFRDFYHETHPIGKPGQKLEDFNVRIKEAIELFDKHKEAALNQDRVQYFYLRGTALNLTEKAIKESEEFLTKALKLNPKIGEAWQELGEYYWKDKNLKESENCFLKAANIERNKRALIALSTLERAKAFKNDAEKPKLIEDSITLAKEALKLDMDDGTSWCNLGTAYVIQFFLYAPCNQIAQMALNALAKAENDRRVKYASELYLNRATLLKYKDEFEKALTNFKIALQYEMELEGLEDKYHETLKYLDDISEFLVTYGKMKAKKLQQLQKSIESDQLGVYKSDYVTVKGETVLLKEIQFSELVIGINNQKVMLGKVICTVHTNGVPYTFILIDKAANRIVLEIFNLSTTHGIVIGDSIAVPEPTVQEINFKHETKHFKFQLVRVDLPFTLAVNGKCLKRHMTVPVRTSVTHTF